MTLVVKNKIFEILEAVHLRVFGHEMSPTMRDFLGHLSWSFLGIFFNGLMLFGINVLAGRILGPVGYGKYNLVLIIVNILSIFILLGLDITSIKYISSSKKMEDKRQYLSNSFFIVLCSSFCVSIFFIFFASQLASLFHVDKNIFLLATIFAIIINLKSLLDSFIKSFNFFKFQSVAKIIEGIIILLFFLLFFFVLRLSNYQYYIFSLIAGYLCLGIIYFVKISGQLVGWDKQKFKNIIKYSRATIVLTVIGIVMVSMDRVFVGKALGLEQLGIYSAYLVSTTGFVGQIILILDNVFSPTINQIEDKDVIIKKVDRLLILSLVPGTALMFLFSFAIMSAFGAKYQFNNLHVLIFSFAAFLQIITSLYRSIVSSIEKSYMRLKKISYGLPLLFFTIYSVLIMADARTLNYFVWAYCLYVILNLLIIRLSYTKTNK